MERCYSTVHDAAWLRRRSFLRSGCVQPYVTVATCGCCTYTKTDQLWSPCGFSLPHVTKCLKPMRVPRVWLELSVAWSGEVGWLRARGAHRGVWGGPGGSGLAVSGPWPGRAQNPQRDDPRVAVKFPHNGTHRSGGSGPGERTVGFGEGLAAAAWRSRDHGRAGLKTHNATTHGSLSNFHTTARINITAIYTLICCQGKSQKKNLHAVCTIEVM